MAPDGNTQGKTTTTTQGRTSANRNSASAGRSDTAQIREGVTKARHGSVAYARHAAERSVDVPFGAVLTVADRVTEIVDPFTKRETASGELKSIRTRVERELNKLER